MHIFFASNFKPDGNPLAVAVTYDCESSVTQTSDTASFRPNSVCVMPSV